MEPTYIVEKSGDKPNIYRQLELFPEYTPVKNSPVKWIGINAKSL